VFVVIKDLIIDISRTKPNQIFAIIEGEKISYKQFNEKIVLIQNTLNSLKSSTKRIALDFDSKLLLFSSLVACNRMRKTPIILPAKDFRQKEVDYIDISKSEHILNQNNCIIQEKGKNILQKSYKYNEKDVQCVLFTSGTELLPKAVELTFSNILYSVNAWNNIFNFSVNDNYLNVLPIHHISGISIFFRSIYFGFKAVYCLYDKKKVLKIIQDNKIDFISVVPKILLDFIENKIAFTTLQKMKLVLIGGDGVDRKIFDYIYSHKINGYISYGMTETSSGVSGYFVNKQEKYKLGYIGKPHQNVQINVKNEKIEVNSKMVMRGYVGIKLKRGLFFTNDKAFINDGDICFKSRSQNMIVSGGENINLDIIESVVKLCDCKVVVIKIPDVHWGEIPIVVYESDSIKKMKNNLKQICKNRLPKFMMPKHFVNIKKIPVKNNNSINYQSIQNFLMEYLK